MTRLQDRVPALITRGGHDWTDRMGGLRQALAGRPVDTAWLDGEVVVLNSGGLPDLNALQNAFDRRRTTNLTYFIFDLLYLNGYDLREFPLRARRALLAELIGEVNDDRIRFSADFAEDPQSLMVSACKMQLEGIIGKRAAGAYSSGRSTD